jgi:hypothetical protein
VGQGAGGRRSRRVIPVSVCCLSCERIKYVRIVRSNVDRRNRCNFLFIECILCVVPRLNKKSYQLTLSFDICVIALFSPDHFYFISIWASTLHKKLRNMHRTIKYNLYIRGYGGIFVRRKKVTASQIRTMCTQSQTTAYKGYRYHQHTILKLFI